MYDEVTLLESFFYLSGYFTLIACAFLLARYLARKSKNPMLIKRFHSFHRPLGYTSLFLAGIHGAIALFSMPSLRVATISGMVSWVLIITLFLSYQERDQKHGNWFRKHQYLALTFIPVILFHLAASAYSDIIA